MTTNNTREHSASESSYPMLVVTKYMGSKKPILNFVADELFRLTEPGDIIVDLMAGTHTIGYALKRKCCIVANDIQRYSIVIGNTLLNYVPQPRFQDQALNIFKRYYNVNMRHMEDLFDLGLRTERAMFATESDKRQTWIAYRDFCEEYPHFMQDEAPEGWPEDYLLLYKSQRVNAYRTLNKLEPYSLFSLYFANTYLGVRQCAEIDSLRFAIDKLCDEWVPGNEEAGYDLFGLRCLLLSALIAVMSHINPGPGHWAAFPRVTQKNRDYLAAQRKIPLLNLFFKKVDGIESAIARQVSPYTPHVVYNEDYVVFMKEVYEYIRQAKVIYLDPPYSQGHYSRFYHLIETLVLYDYPEILHHGRYRTGRHQSPFSHMDEVAGAIGLVCETVRDAGSILVISYSKGGIVPDDKAFISILKDHYPRKKIEVKQLSSVHSKLGQAKRMKTKEYIFTCRP